MRESIILSSPSLFWSFKFAYLRKNRLRDSTKKPSTFFIFKFLIWKKSNKGIHNPIFSQPFLNFKIVLFEKKSFKGIHNPIFSQPFLNFKIFPAFYDNDNDLTFESWMGWFELSM